MTGPRVDPLADLFPPDDPLADLFAEEKEKEKSLLSRLAKGAKDGAVTSLSNLSRSATEASPLFGAAVAAGRTALGGKKATLAPEKKTLAPASSTAEGVGQLLGTVAGELPVSGALGMGLGNIGRTAITKALGPAATKAGAFAKGVVAGLPGNVLAGVATEGALRPEDTFTKEGFARTAAFSSLGGVVDGLFSVRAFNAATNAEEIVQSGIAGLAKQAEEAKLSPEKLQAMREKIDVTMDHMNRLMKGEPISGMKPRAELELPGFPRVRDVGRARGKIPNSDDVTGYAEKLAADVGQRKQMFKERDRIATRMTQIFNKIKTGSHTQNDLIKIEELRKSFDEIHISISNDFKNLSDNINEGVSKLGESAENVRGLRFGGSVDGGGKFIIRNAGKQPAKNFDSPSAPSIIVDVRGNVIQSSPLRPGSGNASPYPHVPVEAGFDALAPALRPKVAGAGNRFDGLSEAENKLAQQIDFGNTTAADARADGRYLLNTNAKIADFKTLDFLRPIKEVGAEAYDRATKFLRVNMRLQAATDDAVYIPVRGSPGEYTRGAESIGPMAKRLNSDPLSLMRAQLYAQARQATSGAITPFDGEASLSIVNSYAKDHPDIVEWYETMARPLVNDMLKMIDGYELSSLRSVENMLREGPEWAPLSRVIFGDPSATTGFLKARTNPGSEKIVSDYWHSMYANIRGLVKAGERSSVLRELAKARQKNPDLAGIIDIVPYKTPEDAIEILNKLPKDAPEQLKEFMVDVFNQPKGNTYTLYLDDTRVSIVVSNEVKASLDMMQFNGWKAYDPPPVSTTLANRVASYAMAPLRAVAGAEKTATGIYSIYRDLLGFGVPLDAVETGINAWAKGYKFNPFIDPVKGFMGLYRNDPVIRDLAGFGAGKSFRYANPMAEGIVENVEELTRIASLSGFKLRFSSPTAMKKAFVEFAGNLSNASSAGFVLRNQERGMKEMASRFNDIIGDPAKSGAYLGIYARYTGFMNYPLQATRAQIEALAKSPQNLAMFAARISGMLVVPTLAYEYLTRDNQDIKSMEQDQAGSRFMYLPTAVGNEVLAVPKPQGIAGVLGVTMPQMMMRELRDSGQTEMFESIGKAALQSIMPNLIPLTANLGIGLVTGKSVGIGQPAIDLVPRSRQDMLAEDAGSAGTTNTSQFLANVTNIQAGKWERVFRTFMIGTSFNIFQGIDYELGDKKGAPIDNPLTLFPGIRKVRTAKAGTKAVSDFYDEVTKTSAVLNSYNKAINDGMPERANEVFSRNEELYGRAIELAPSLDMMKTLNSQINTLRYNEYMNEDQKREAIEELTRRRIKLAQDALKKKEN